MSAPPAPKKARRSEISRMMQDDSIISEEDMDSPFTLYFVDLPDAKPTEQETRNLEELFNIAKEAGTMPEWIDSESMERIETSDDFFVLPCFRGKLFRKLQARDIKLYGPPIVLECFEEQKELPQWNHPVYSSVFEGVKISFTSIEPEQKRDLVEKIGWMCGVVSKNLYHESTHLVAGKAEQTEKYKVAVKNSIKLMRKEWVDDLWQKSQTTMGKFSALVRDAVNSYRLKVFQGLEMAITSIDGADRNNLIQLIQEHGGKVPGNMSRSRCSHLITDKTTGQKYTKAVEWKTLHIVQTRWVRKCIDLGNLIDEAKYHPKYLSAEHIRCSTPKRDANVTESGPDVSSIAGPGGRLSTSSFNLSSAITPMEQSQRRQSQSSFTSMTSTSNIAATTITSNDVTIGRTNGGRRSDQHSTPITRTNTVPLLVRYPTTQDIASTVHDPIDDLRKQIGDKHENLFEDCNFYICGVDEARMDKWRRFLNETGATRVPKFESASHVVVVSPNQQERITLRKFLQREDIAIVTVQWVTECVKKGEIVPTEGFEWTESTPEDFLSQQPASPNLVHIPSTASLQSCKTSIPSCSEPENSTAIFTNQTYFVHSTLGKAASEYLREKIRNNGGKLESIPEKADFVVFGHSAPMHDLLLFDRVVTDFYIETCIDNSRLLSLGNYPLFVPLPRSPLPIFNHLRFVLQSKNEFVNEYVKTIIETNGGTVIKKMDSNSYQIMLEEGRMTAEHRTRTADFSWIVSSVSMCRLQPLENHLYQENSKPLKDFQRTDDVWDKCLREKDTTDEMEVEVEERYRVQDHPTVTGNGRKSNLSIPIENQYFPDLRKPYKMNLKLDGAYECIDNMESPARDTQESMTTSRVGSILRKAVVNTGRDRGGTEKENEPLTCQILPSRIAIAENRRTVSSTPVLVRDVDRSVRYMPMDDSFADQNQEHEELVREYAMHPHFLLSISNMNPQESAELQEAIKQLGGHIERDFNRDVTHLITSSMQRTPKVLSSIAAGKWCLTPDYVTQSTSAGRWLDEKPFEWSPNKLPRIETDRESLKDQEVRKITEKLVTVCGVWRAIVSEMPITCSVQMENRFNGAFTGWLCVIHHEDNKTQKVSSILEAGGAVVNSITNYIDILTIQPNRVFASKDFEWNPQSAAMLKRDGVQLFNHEIIYEYLVDKDNLDCSKYLHPAYKKV